MSEGAAGAEVLLLLLLVQIITYVIITATSIISTIIIARSIIPKILELRNPEVSSAEWGKMQLGSSMQHAPWRVHGFSWTQNECM